MQIQPRNDANLQPIQELQLLLGLWGIRLLLREPSALH